MRSSMGSTRKCTPDQCSPAPPTPLNVEIGPHRRFIGVPSRLGDFQLVKKTFGGTVNDVVLTVRTGALREFLISRGVRTEGLELRALVPVSTRAQDERGGEQGAGHCTRGRGDAAAWKGRNGLRRPCDRA